MKEEVTMKDQLDEFNKLILDLANVNIVLEDEDKAPILSSSLLDHISTLWRKNSLSLKDVKNTLQSKDFKKIIK